MRTDTILCAVDLTPLGERVLGRGIELARPWSAEVHAVHALNLVPRIPVADPMHPVPTQRLTVRRADDVNTQLQELLDRFAVDDVTLRGEVRHGDTARCILDCAEELGADLIVIGTRGRTGVSRLLGGNTAEKLVRRAAVPVLSLPAPAPA